MNKSQIPNPKSQTNPNDQNSNDRNKFGFGRLVIGIWVLFGIWCLEFGILNFVFSSFTFAADEEGGHMQAAKDIIQLPAPRLKGALSLEETIYKRRCKRSFSQKAMTLDEVGQLLWAGQGVTNRRGFRAAPSAGALYPLEIYALTKDGFFHYLPEGHRLKVVSREDLRRELCDAAWGQGFIREAALDIVICAVYSRVTSKYGQRGIRYTDMEVGHAAQNIQLEAVSLGLGSCVVGAFDTKEVAGLLSLPKDQEPVYIIPVGYSK